jgi:hypothetical protein
VADAVRSFTGSTPAADLTFTIATPCNDFINTDVQRLRICLLPARILVIATIIYPLRAS